MELFRKDVPLLLKLQEREQKHQKITIAVHWKESTSPLSNKELVIRLTDDSDPFFLYALSLNEDDYSGLRSQQGLLLDFAVFPPKFIEMLNSCLNEESSSDAPKLHLQLVSQSVDRSSALLNVVEASSFKHLTHLSLKVLLASDSVLKKYLAECLMALRDQKTMLSQTLDSERTTLTSKLSQSQELLARRTAEVEQLRAEWSSSSCSLSSKHTREVEAERARATLTLADLTKKFETEKQSLIQSYEGKLLHLETKAQSLESHNRVLSEAKYKLEAAITELKSKLQVAENDLSAVRQEAARSRQEGHSLGSTLHDQERSLQQLGTRVAVQEQDIKNKDEVISRTNQLLNTSSEQKLKLEAAVEAHLKQIAKLDTAYTKTSQEVHKGNEIIQKLQNDRVRVQGKLKMKNIAVVQQEKLIEEKEARVIQHKREIESLTRAIGHKEEEVSKLTGELSSAKDNLEKNKGVIEKNNSVIEWLQRQLNEYTISSVGSGGVGHVGPPKNSLPSFPTPPIPNAATGFNRPQYTSTPTSIGGRQVFGSLNSQQNVLRAPQVTFRGHLKGAAVASGSAGDQDKPYLGLPASRSQGDPKVGGDENKTSSLPGKYIAPERSSPASGPSQPSLKPSPGLPSIATHQYMSGASPVITPPTTQVRERTAATTVGQK